MAVLWDCADSLDSQDKLPTWPTHNPWQHTSGDFLSSAGRNSRAKVRWLLGVEVGSAWSTAVSSAVLIIVCLAVPASTVAEMLRVAEAPFASEVTDQRPEILLYVPTLAECVE